MSTMDRREFIRKTAAVVGTTLAAPALGSDKACPPAATRPAARKVLRAADTVTLGKTRIKTSRLAIGIGTRGGWEQYLRGKDAMVKLLRYGFDQGLRWWDTAIAYRTHPYIQAALKEVKRDELTITSKTRAKDAAGVRADIERLRKDLNTDYVDVLLLHCMKDADWPEKMKGAMDALSEARQKGRVRAVGCSYHAVPALQAAADEPWAEVNLARINPFAVTMDVKKPENVPLVEKALQVISQRGRVVYGMKVLGEGGLKGNQIDESLRFVLNKPYVSAFTIGFSHDNQIDDIIQRIDRIRAATTPKA